jgi:ATP synthase protein I
VGKAKKTKKALRQASTWLNVSIIGIQFPVAMLIGFFWGKWMDGIFGTWPWLTMVFSLFGIIAGFVNLFRMTAQASRTEEDQLRPELGLDVYPPDEEDDDEDRDADSTA